MNLFERHKEKTGLMDVIRCDDPSYLIWKWRSAGSDEEGGRRENAIRWGSSLRVKEGEVAVFEYRQNDGVMQDFIEGPFDQILKTKNLPILANIIGLAYDGNTPFQAEIYFINLAKIIQIKFAVPYFDLFDPRFLDFGIPTAVRGTLTFQISDYREFIKLHRLQNFDLDRFENEIKDAVIKYVKGIIANVPGDQGIPVLQIERKTLEINEAVKPVIETRCRENFGVTVTGVDIAVIEIDKTSDGYLRLKSITQDVTAATVRAQTEVNIKDIHDKQRIQVENLQESLRIQREEGQYALHKQTQSSNLAAFQTEKQAEVGIAGANALGQMGAGGGGNVELGGGMGFNPAAMMAGMAVGGAIGQNIAGTMNGMMTGVNQIPNIGTVPPPIPENGYHVASGGRAIGPYDVGILEQMYAGGQFTKESLVWKSGMTQWAQADSVPELSVIFQKEMPPIPQT